MPLTHKQKTRLARQMRTPIEAGQSVGLFESLAWRKRKWAVQQRVKRQQIRSHYWSELRRGERGQQKSIA